MALIKKVKLGSTEINFYDDAIPTSTEDKKKNIIKLYDTINNIADKAEKRGIDTSKWFYTDKQLKLLKEEKKELFI